MASNSAKRCYECDKSFEVMNPQGYRYTKVHNHQKRYFCCYTCYTKFLKKLEEEKTSRTEI